MEFKASWEPGGMARCRILVADPEQLQRLWLNNFIAPRLSFHQVLAAPGDLTCKFSGSVPSIFGAKTKDIG